MNERRRAKREKALKKRSDQLTVAIQKAQEEERLSRARKLSFELLGVQREMDRMNGAILVVASLLSLVATI